MERPSNSTTILAAMLLLVIGIWIIGPRIAEVFHEVDTSKVPQPGELGDTYGSINALFAGLAFAGLIWTILLQRQELQATRTAMLLQVKELESSSKAQHRLAAEQERSRDTMNDLVEVMRSQLEQSKQVKPILEIQNTINGQSRDATTRLANEIRDTNRIRACIEVLQALEPTERLGGRESYPNAATLQAHLRADLLDVLGSTRLGGDIEGIDRASLLTEMRHLQRYDTRGRFS